MIRKFIKYVGCFVLAAVLVVGAVFAYRFFSVSVEREYIAPHQVVSKDYRKMFCDSNAKQVAAADRMGVRPLDDVSGIPELIAQGRLKTITTCKYYICVAAMPFLTPEAADLLAEIGRRYQNNIGSRWDFVIVTSCFRTRESVAILQKHNGNAVKNSCHLRGTTFDITYARMSKKQKQALAQALRDLQMAGYCHVIYEKRQPCFHITVNK